MATSDADEDRPAAGRLTIRRGPGASPLVTEGPLAEIVEQLSGFYIVTCDDYDALAEAAGMTWGSHSRWTAGQACLGVRGPAADVQGAGVDDFDSDVRELAVGVLARCA